MARKLNGLGPVKKKQRAEACCNAKSCGTLEARAAESWQLAPPCALPAPRCSRKSLAQPSFNIRAHRVAIVTAEFPSPANRLSTVRTMRR